MSDNFAEDLLERPSCEAVSNILVSDRLIGRQSIDVLAALKRESAIISYDTGLGKTYLASGIIRMLLNEDPTRKFIMIVKNKQLEQTPKKIEKCTGVTVTAMNATQQSVNEYMRSGKFKDSTVLMITYSCLQNRVVMDTLLENRQLYCCLIIDEAHNLNNVDGADSAMMLRGMCRAFKYRFALTATPIVSDVNQYARLANILDPVAYPDSAKLARDLKSGRFSIKDDPMFFIERTRKDFGVHSYIVGEPYFVDCMAHQFGAKGMDMTEVCKGDGAINQAQALVEFIRSQKGKRGLVYVNRHSIRNWLLPFLDEAGIRYGCINGNTKRSDDKEVMRKFNETKELDIVITSITEAIDLDCDWVMFYELTLNVDQMIGRAYRGLDDKELHVYFMLTKDTYEADFFYENIFARSQVVKNILGKEYTAVFDTQRKIEQQQQW